jgi:hypothetical protein
MPCHFSWRWPTVTRAFRWTPTDSCVVEVRVDDLFPTRAVTSLDPSTAGGAGGPPNPVVTSVEVLSAGGGSRSTAPEALRDCPPLFALEPRLFACRVSTALVVLSCPPTAGSAADPPNTC